MPLVINGIDTSLFTLPLVTICSLASPLLTVAAIALTLQFNRLFFFAFRVSSMPLAQTAENFTAQTWYDKINNRLTSLRGNANRSFSIKEFMLPDDHRDVLTYREKRRDWQRSGNDADKSSGASVACGVTYEFDDA